MIRRGLLALALALLFLTAACGGDDDGVAATSDASSEVAATSDADGGVTVTGDGFTATFPGEVERRSDPVQVAGVTEPMSAESSTWETDSEALSIITTVLPPGLVDPQRVSELLEGTAMGMGGTTDPESPLLDADGSFQGREAVAFEVVDGDLVTSGVAFQDGDRLVQVLHLGRVGEESDRLEVLLDGFSFTG
ncbi:hypothetical protein [Rhabdothermincola salaria]|uniref:hypothetical protein n=1 Tax=Rhabdothermincola salaria TaxID=2903142 RepID=UPI001E63F65B|nr:hypothetical protein [Rhabdothermincola salaria]MCD9625028.1 hypothetical protein [Rhabdothermincola salaria]